jgi:hypothetical protein
MASAPTTKIKKGNAEVEFHTQKGFAFKLFAFVLLRLRLFFCYLNQISFT